MNSRSKLGFVTLGLALLVGSVLMSFPFIGSISLGLFVYYCTRPIYRVLVNKGLNKTISAVVAQLAFVLPSLLLVLYTVQIIAFEIRQFAINATGTISERLQDQELIRELIDERVILDIIPLQGRSGTIGGNESIRSVDDLINNLDFELINEIFNLSVNITTVLVSSIGDLFFTLLIAFALSFYLQRDGHKVLSTVYELVNHDRDVHNFFKKLDKDLKVVFLGNIALALLTSILGATCFYLISAVIPGGELLKYPGLIGFLCGIASLIPVVGMKLVYFPITGVLFINALRDGLTLDGLIFPIVFFIVALIIVDGIPDFIARPYLGSLSGISTGILLFSYIFGPLAFGWYGLFLGPLIFVTFYEFIEHIMPLLLDEFDRNRT